MSTMIAIPVMIQPAAAARVAALDMQASFVQMLEHTKRAVPSLRSIEVTLQHDPEGIDEPKVVLDATRDDPDADYDPTQWEWNEWAVDHFPPEVLRHFVMMVLYGATNER